MKKSTENKNPKNFLKEGVKDDISKHHKNCLGTDIPENYFIKSKISILEKIKSEEINEKKQLIFWMQPQFRYIAAASLVFILSLTVWLQNVDKNDDFNTNNFELLSFSDDILINSLLVEDSELEAFAETTLMNEVIIKAELSEQKMDNLFLNSIILEDSLTDDYINYELLETIIL
jgi:hypothetical protein